MAVTIRMKMMGRKHRPFFRICAVDSRKPRDGRVLEELGTYDPMITNVDARALLKAERIDYWLGVGAQPSVNVRVLIKKYGTNGTHVKLQAEARNLLAQPKTVPDPGEPAYVLKPKDKEQPVAQAAAASEEASGGNGVETVQEQEATVSE